MEKIINIVLLGCSIVIVTNAFAAQNSENKDFINYFPEAMRESVQEICQNLNNTDNENGIYYSRSNLDKYKILSLKNNHYNIYIFNRDWRSDVVKLVFFANGLYKRDGYKIALETSSRPNDNNIYDHRELTWVKDENNSYLINDLKDSASSISWNKTLGRPSEFLKRIDCNINSIRAYKGDDEIAPDYKKLPHDLAQYVLEKPLHLEIAYAFDVSKEIAKQTDSEAYTVQVVKFKINDISKLSLNQPVCILFGRSKGAVGHLKNPESPISKAWFSYYKANVNERTTFPQKGDILTTSKFECDQITIKNPSET